MKEEIKRIMKLVQEGKLSPEDAAELVEAFTEAPDDESAAVEETTEEAPPKQEEPAAQTNTEAQAEEPAAPPVENPFARFLNDLEKVGKDVAGKVDWNDIAGQVRTGVGKGVEALKKAAEEAKLGQGVGFIFGSQEVKVVELPLSVPAGKTLRIEGTSGSIQVTGSDSDLGSLKASATFRAYNEEEAKKKASVYTPFIEENEQYVTVRLQEGPDSSVDAVIVTSRSTQVEIRHTSGAVSAHDLHAPVKVNSTSSDVRLSGLQGPVELSLVSGDVAIERSDMKLLSVETKSGDVEAKDCQGSASIRTSSGSVKLERHKGRTISIEAASGDVEVDLLEAVEGSVTIRAVSGDVKLEVPDGSDCKVSLATLQGMATCRLALEDMAQEGAKISGRLRAGAGTIDLSTVSGDVVLEMRDATS